MKVKSTLVKRATWHSAPFARCSLQVFLHPAFFVMLRNVFLKFTLSSATLEVENYETRNAGVLCRPKIVLPSAPDTLLHRYLSKEISETHTEFFVGSAETGSGATYGDLYNALRYATMTPVRDVCD